MVGTFLEPRQPHSWGTPDSTSSTEEEVDTHPWAVPTLKPTECYGYKYDIKCSHLRIRSVLAIAFLKGIRSLHCCFQPCPKSLYCENTFCNRSTGSVREITSPSFLQGVWGSLFSLLICWGLYWVGWFGFMLDFHESTEVTSKLTRLAEPHALAL